MRDLLEALRGSFDGIFSVTPGSMEGNVLLFLLLNYTFLLAEILFGTAIQSLGLVCDGVHMLINCFGITISWFALRIAKTHPNGGNYTYGFGRVQVVAAFTNAVFLVFVAFFLVIQAVQRLVQPVDIHSSHAFTVACLSLGLNLGGVSLLGFWPGTWRARNTPVALTFEADPSFINLQSVSTHMKADMYSSIGVMVSSLSMRWKGWTFMDPLVSIVILTLILRSAVPLLVQTGLVLLQTTPKTNSRELEQAVRELNTLRGVIECHEHHFWTFAEGRVVATIKLRVRDDASRDEVLLQAFRCLPPW